MAQAGRLRRGGRIREPHQGEPVHRIQIMSRIVGSGTPRVESSEGGTEVTIAWLEAWISNNRGK